MTYRIILAGVADRALAARDSDDERRAVYASLRELAGRLRIRRTGTTTITVWKVGTVA
ncbi:hypothetical protein ABH926_008361 [Catenulispora sp. GP43]|uniref:hypothetical protein n=1 Tax=Catenulispora sp. GP43 TaxID=3156263 RepID=UPI0035115F10